MPVLYFLLIAICMIAAYACDLCHWATSLIVLIYDVIGVIFCRKCIKRPKLSIALGILLFLILISLDIINGGSIQTVYLNVCFDLVWTMIGYRAISHHSMSDRLQVGILSLLPLTCVAMRLQASSFLIFLFVYLIVWTGFLCEQSVQEPNSGNVAVTFHKELPLNYRFWIPAAGTLFIALIAGSSLFLVVPRYGGKSNSPVPSVEKTAGQFPDVALDKTGEINVDPTLIFRAQVPDALTDDNVYWRIDVQNAFNGTSWSAYYPNPQRPEPASDFDKSTALHLTFSHEWHDHRIPTITHTRHVTQTELAEPNRPIVFYPDSAGVWHRWGWNRQNPLTGYDYWYDESVDQTRELSFNSRHIWPSRRQPEVRQRLTDLANQIVGDAATNETKAVRIRDYLQSHYRYSLNRPVRSGFIVEDFLYRQPIGHCEVFSTTMAVLLARLDVPVRNVTGFVSNEFRDGENYVRAAHAHSWVEVWLDETRGWTVFDPTPSGAQKVEVDWLVRFNDWFSSYQPRDLYAWLQTYGLILLGILLSLGAGLALIRFPVAYFRRHLASPEVTCQNAWKSLQVHLKDSPLSQIPLENWWSDEFDVSLQPIQTLARRYIQMQYRPNMIPASLSASARFKFNRETLRLLKLAMHVKPK